MIYKFLTAAAICFGSFQAMAQSRDAYSIIQAESFNAQVGAGTTSTYIQNADNGDYVRYDNVNFGTGGVQSIEMRLAVTNSQANMNIEVRINSRTGTLLGTLKTVSTGSASTYTVQRTAIANTSGSKTLFLVFPGRSPFGRLDHFQFVRSSSPPPPPPPSPSAPTIQSQPQGGTYDVGQAISLRVTAASSLPMTYQWYKDNVAIQGQTSNAFSKSSAQAADAGQYHVMIANSSGSVKSATVAVSINAPPPPPPPGSAFCPAGSIVVAVGSSIQSAVSAAATNASFCIKSGVHRLQSVNPKAGQKFYGESGTILNGARLLTSFTREGSFWVASGQTQQGVVRGVCDAGQACNLPEGLFINDVPLTQVTSKASATAGKFYFDYAADKIFFSDDPTGKKVEATATTFAFSGTASNVLIKSIIVEKYSSPAQEGAVMGENASGWSVEDSEFRFNSGTGVAVGTNGRIVNCKIHRNGQMGATAGGQNILIEGNEMAYNNIYGFSFAWEAGAIKVTESNGVIYRNNHVHHNRGPGLWSDENVYNAVYEGNTVEYNDDAGIFHEISYNAIIRNNTLRYNGQANLGWVWGADIQLASAQDVEIFGNNVTVRNNGTGIIVVDQNRGPNKFGTLYKSRNNYVHDNIITFDGEGSSGGISDSETTDENYNIIETGNNRFNSNTYRVKNANYLELSWGHVEVNFSGFRNLGQEINGQLVLY